VLVEALRATKPFDRLRANGDFRVHHNTTSRFRPDLYPFGRRPLRSGWGIEAPPRGAPALRYLVSLRFDFGPVHAARSTSGTKSPPLSLGRMSWTVFLKPERLSETGSWNRSSH